MTKTNFVSAATSRKYCLQKQPVDSRDFIYHRTDKAAIVPSSVDLRDTGLVPPILDQGQLGSCTANASANCLHYLLKKENVHEFSPSRLFIYYYTRVAIEHTSPREDSGANIRDVCRAIASYHVCDERVWPYYVSKFSTHPSATAVRNANIHKQLKYVSVPQDLVHLKACLASGFPIFFGMDIYESFESDEVAQTGIIPMPDTENEQLLGGHCTSLWGYDDKTQCFLGMNSWGSGWGAGGYFHIPYDLILSNIASDFWSFSLFD